MLVAVPRFAALCTTKAIRIGASGAVQRHPLPSTDAPAPCLWATQQRIEVHQRIWLAARVPQQLHMHMHARKDCMASRARRYEITGTTYYR